MYTDINFRTKKHLKEAVKSGQNVHVLDPGGRPTPENGKVYLEGPHYPTPHSWYAEATLKDGRVVSVK